MLEDQIKPLNTFDKLEKLGVQYLRGQGAPHKSGSSLDGKDKVGRDVMT